TEMMAIPGKSCEETRVAEFIRKKLTAAGIPRSAILVDDSTKRIPHGGAIGNLIVKLPGTVKGPRRMLMAHIDTVPLCVGSKPVRKGGLIVSKDPRTALGADDRAGASVVLNSILEIRKRKLPHPPLTLFWPVQEEIGLLGARHVKLSNLGNPKLCFNWDGGPAHTATIGATGGYDLEIKVFGIASHAGVHPEHGVSAIAIASMAIADLVQHGWHGLVVKGEKTGTSNLGIITAGDATNVVASSLVIQAEARSHDPAFRKVIVSEFQQAFERAAASLSNAMGQRGRIEFRADLKYESFRIPEDAAAVQSAFAAARAVGLTPEPRITNGGLDANWLSARGLPTVTLGCGQQSPHTVAESLHIDSYLAACKMGLLLATGAA
ncbi:MAG: M20/M25/M40 family metallo-hydrolase, partial [Planctomycetaceae bacterium]